MSTPTTTPARIATTLVVLLVLFGCSAGGARIAGSSAGSPESRATQSTGAEAPEGAPTAQATLELPAEFDSAAAFATVEQLAGQIGPREATSAAFHQAADWVTDRFEDLGYAVTEVDVPVPAGDPSYRPEWGTVTQPGTSRNVIADPPGFDAGQPHVVLGAHLDTVAVAPGAEDNASGVAVLMELARMAAEEPGALPIRFIAFGAEEPRASGDDMHHFGSQQYVADLSTAERDAVRAMVALDRVGVPAPEVPVCTGGTGATSVLDDLLAAADRAGIAAAGCENRASDHWSFEKADIPAARLGSVPYAGYHSAGDTAEVVDPDQLDRVGTIVWRWLSDLAG